MNAINKKLCKLKLSGMAVTLQQRLEQAMEQKWSYSDLLEILFADEIESKENKQLTRRIAKSRMDPIKTLETFDFNFNAKIPTSLIKELASCNFMEKKQNIFILGPSGSGKSHLAQAFGHQACRNEYDVLFYCTYQLFEWVYAGRGDGSHKRRLDSVIKMPLVIIDDFGLQTLNEVQQADLYQLIAERYEKRATIITSNKDFSEWPSIFTNQLIGTAALDRLVHRGIQLVIDVPSYRLAEFKKTCADTKRSAINSKINDN
jgi:DNA replication protein DnaC